MQTIITATRIRGTWTVRTAAGISTGPTFAAALAGVQS